MTRKILTAETLPSYLRKIRSQKKRIVFTNGTFDILHVGHIRYLEKAKQLGDLLIVGVNTDRSVKSYKTPDRPINPEKDRIEVLSALACVDQAILFDEPTPLNLILTLRPSVLVKGGDWKKSQIAGAKQVVSWGGKVVLIPFVAGRSTTRVIKKIKSRKA